ncbi:MAG: serine hydrolase domain-containing protein [Verrucomicrobiota bacterium]
MALSLRRLASLLLLWLAIFPSAAFAGDLPQLRSQLSVLLDQACAQVSFAPHTPGFALLISQNGRLLHEDYRGLAQVRKRHSIDAKTPFRIASVSKPFAALAITQLAEQKRLFYQDPVQVYLPSFPRPHITIHHLLNHSSGLPDYTAFPFLKAKADAEDVLKALSTRKPEFSPGSQVRYSNTNYAILALIIERVSGQSLANYYSQFIFSPSGMTETYLPGQQWKQVPDQALGYERRLHHFTPLESDTYSRILGPLGIFSSAEDLDRWLHALFGHQLCAPEGLQAGLQPSAAHRPGFGPPYGYGWVITQFGPEELVWHNGHWLGFDSFVARLQRQRTNIILLCNGGYEGRKRNLTDDLGFPIVDLLMQANLAL